MPEPAAQPGPPAKKPVLLAPENYGWLAIGIGVSSTLLGNLVLAVACFTAMAVWVAATIKLGLEISVVGLIAEVASLAVVLIVYGAEQLWLFLRGRYKRDLAVTLPIKIFILAEHAVALGLLGWLSVRVFAWIRELQAAAA